MRPVAEDRAEVTGNRDAPLLEQTIGESLSLAAARWSDRSAVIAPNQNVCWTWAELDEKAQIVAANLLRNGLRPGDRVGIWSPNRSEWILVQFAAAKAGLVLVTINPAYRREELRHTLKSVQVAALFMAARFKTSNYCATVRELICLKGSLNDGRVCTPDLPDLTACYLFDDEAESGFLPFSVLCEPVMDDDRRALDALGSGINNREAVNIQFTSGTTGLPKGATLSHRGILNNGHNLARTLGLDAHDRLCLPVPLYHCFGMVMGVLACLTSGCAIVLPAEGFDPAATLRTIESERCTVLYGVPTMFVAELAEQEHLRCDFSSLSRGVMAGALCPEDLMLAVRRDMGIADLVICYGMTETSPVSFQTSRDDLIALQTTTVGRIQPHLEAKVMRDDGRVALCGEVGELCTRGYSVMLGYWGEPEQTAQAIDQDRWMHTGDLATIDKDGYCRIVGRSKDMIIRGGENIYPAEIETVLRTMPGVRDAQIVGLPDARLGEIICACIMRHGQDAPDERTVVEWVRERLAHYKVPAIVRFVDAFPLTATGKVQKFALREAILLSLDSDK